MRFVFGPLAFGVSLAALALACTTTTTTTSSEEAPDGGKATSTNPTDPKGSTSSSSSSSSSGGAGGTVCEQVCANAASAKCSGQANCVKDCEAQSGQVPASCKTEYDAAMQCAAKATSFKCSSSGKATAVGCDTEGNALVQCVMGGGGSSSGGSSSGGGGNCGNLSTGNTTCDSCVDAKCCTPAAACGADCVAIINCMNNCNDAACDAQCENQHPAGKAAEQAILSCVSKNCNAQCQ